MSQDFVKSVDQQLSVDELLERIDYDRIPKHVCIIMDGNRRWAKERGLNGFLGHKEGVKAFRKILIASCELGIEVLTVYAFSMENWRRSDKEVQMLMELFKQYCHKERELMKDIGVNFNVIGKLDVLSPELLEVFENTRQYTAEGKRTHLNLCINYGSRYEMLEGAKKLALDIKEGRVDPDTLVEEDFSDYLYTAGLPDPDLMIRTSGELRISNFLLWQNAYAEFWFTGLYWPDFDKKALLTAIIDYQQRDRRFGGTTETQK